MGSGPFEEGSISSTDATQVPCQDTRVELLSSNSDGTTAVPRRRAVTSPGPSWMARALSTSEQCRDQSSPSGAAGRNPCDQTVIARWRSFGSRRGGAAGRGAGAAFVAARDGRGDGLFRAHANITRDVASTNTLRTTRP